jgi:RNA polymerase sigma factor (sigma-70 family)
MTDTPSLVLLSRWRDQADQKAAAELFQRYSARLVALARKRMSAKLARRTDAEDVVQSVCRTFFLRVRDGRLDVQPGSDIWQLLVAITVRKVFAQAEFHTAGKRTVRKEDSVVGCESISLPPVEALANEPGVAETAALREEIERILSQLIPVRRRIVELHLEGYTQSEIATETNRGERLVRIALDEFKELLQQRWADAEMH